MYMCWYSLPLMCYIKMLWCYYNVNDIFTYRLTIELYIRIGLTSVYGSSEASNKVEILFIKLIVKSAKMMSRK